MAKSLSDHQDSEHFSYSRTWDEIEAMLDKAEKTLNYHELKMMQYEPKSKRWVFHAATSKPFKVLLKLLDGHLEIKMCRILLE